jgi:hypothetical protein
MPITPPVTALIPFTMPGCCPCSCGILARSPVGRYSRWETEQKWHLWKSQSLRVQMQRARHPDNARKSTTLGICASSPGLSLAYPRSRSLSCIGFWTRQRGPWHTASTRARRRRKPYVRDESGGNISDKNTRGRFRESERRTMAMKKCERYRGQHRVARNKMPADSRIPKQ